jgi:excisionase family DNA binding protein
VINDEPDTLLSTTQVGAMCGVASMTVIRWIDNGVLPAIRTPGGWRRVRRADAERHAARIAGRRPAPALSPSDLAALFTIGGRDAALAWARAQAGTGRTVGDLVLSHLAPAMRLIGDGWECGDTSVGEEHRATALAYDLLALLREVLPARNPAAASVGRLLLVCAPGEEHALPARMASERFVDAGWAVDLLGANVPAAETARQLEVTQPDVLGLSITTSSAGARAVLREIAGSSWRGPILAGGALAARVVRGWPGILVDDGSDAYIERVTSQISVTREQAE